MMTTRRTLIGSIALLATILVIASAGTADAKGKGKRKVKKAKLTQTQRLEPEFHKFDANGDNKLSLEEFTNFLKARHAKHAAKVGTKVKTPKKATGKKGKKHKKHGNRAAKLFSKLDTNKDGFLSFEEFARIAHHHHHHHKHKKKTAG